VKLCEEGTGRAFYYNVVSQARQWEVPIGYQVCGLSALLVRSVDSDLLFCSFVSFLSWSYHKRESEMIPACLLPPLDLQPFLRFSFAAQEENKATCRVEHEHAVSTQVRGWEGERGGGGERGRGGKREWEVDGLSMETERETERKAGERRGKITFYESRGDRCLSLPARLPSLATHLFLLQPRLPPPCERDVRMLRHYFDPSTLPGNREDAKRKKEATGRGEDR